MLAADAHSTKGGRHERGKAERRRRIKESTCALLREVGIDELSMKAVADGAGLSLSTIYNLFPSKQSVLTEIFDEDLAQFEARVAGVSSIDPLARIFDAVDVAKDLYRKEPNFYRAIMWRQPTRSVELNRALIEPRSRFWRLLVEEAIRKGFLRRSTDSLVISALMGQNLGGTIQQWILGEISLDRLEVETKLGFAIVFAAFATPASKARLRRMIVDLCQQSRTLITEAKVVSL